MPIPDDNELHELAETLGVRLRDSHHRLVTAESCTGGWIAKAVTDIAGSSDWFDCGMAAYSYEAKQALLGVRPETLETHGAVSRETVIERVAGALVNSTLGLLSIVASGNCVGLLPRQIAVHPFAVQHLQVVAVAEGPLKLSLGALARADAALKPAVRHFMAHLHRAAHHLSNTF